MASRDDLVSAPPDAGGDHGVFTRPDEELQTRDAGDRKYPESDQDPAEPGGGGSALSAFAWTTVFLIIVAFFFYALGGSC